MKHGLPRWEMIASPSIAPGSLLAHAHPASPTSRTKLTRNSNQHSTSPHPPPPTPHRNPHPHPPRPHPCRLPRHKTPPPPQLHHSSPHSTPTLPNTRPRFLSPLGPPRPCHPRESCPLRLRHRRPRYAPRFNRSAHPNLARQPRRRSRRARNATSRRTVGDGLRRATAPTR